MKQKRSTLLKVMSIIFIVLGALAILGNIMTFAMKGIMDQSYAMLGMTPPPMWYYVFALVYAVVELIAGIIGVMYKSKKSVLMIGIVYCAFFVLGLVLEVVLGMFTFLSLINIVFPLLFMWGLYQSE